MNKKKTYKEIFSKQIAGGFQFGYLNLERTIEKYCLEKDCISIYFIEDYRHEWLSMKVVWDKCVTLISCEGIKCCAKIQCKSREEMEEKLKKIFISNSGNVTEQLSENQYYEMVNIYYEFLENNNFFENVVWDESVCYELY